MKLFQSDLLKVEGLANGVSVLTEDLWLIIFRYLDPEALARHAWVCHQWNDWKIEMNGCAFLFRPGRAKALMDTEPPPLASFLQTQVSEHGDYALIKLQLDLCPLMRIYKRMQCAFPYFDDFTLPSSCCRCEFQEGYQLYTKPTSQYDVP